MISADPLVVHGWVIFAHPLFLSQLEALVAEVEAARTRDPQGYKRRNPAKRLAAITKLVFDLVPRDPGNSEFRQGGALGAERRHWFRAKFFKQYRLFFRFSSAEQVIIYVWVNDDDTLRAYGSSSDAYRVFARMLERGRAPDSWPRLKSEAVAAARRLRRIAARLPED